MEKNPGLLCCFHKNIFALVFLITIIMTAKNGLIPRIKFLDLKKTVENQDAETWAETC